MDDEESMEKDRNLGQFRIYRAGGIEIEYVYFNSVRFKFVSWCPNLILRSALSKIREFYSLYLLPLQCRILRQHM